MTYARLELGARGELAAADHLQNKGLQIVDRNYRTRFGELDIVAASDRALVFVEVKTKAATGRELNPIFSVGPRKQRQVRQMAKQWLAARGDRPYRDDIRFDVIGLVIAPSGEITSLEHIERAF